MADQALRASQGLETGSGRLSAQDRERLIAAPTLSRRHFVEALGAGFSALGLAACGKPPPEDIVPYVQRPPEVVPGVARFYATSCERSGYALGLLGESHEGRPTKLEGHPLHPATLGAASAAEQAEIYALYDEQRARGIRNGSGPATLRALGDALGPSGGAPFTTRQGEGLHVLFAPSSSPLLARTWARVKQRYPKAVAHYFDGAGTPARWAATERLFGSALDPHYDLSRARRVLALGADFLAEGPASLRLARDFSEQRGPLAPGGARNRLYAAECSLSPTGASADQRLSLPPSQLGTLAGALFAALASAQGGDVRALGVRARGAFARHPAWHWAERCAADLLGHPGESALLVGERLPVAAQVLGAAAQQLLGARGAALGYLEPAPLDAGGASWSLEPLLAALDAGAVDTLLILGVNPAYALPPDARWQSRVHEARERVHLSLYENETSRDASWFVASSHFLEEWGDGRAWDGTLTLRQPLLRPLLGGVSALELLALLLGEAPQTPRARLLESAAAWLPDAGDFDAVLERGFLEGSSRSVQRVAPSWDAVARAIDELAAELATEHDTLELEVRPDPRFGLSDLSNVPWLQELPAPVTKLVWDNAALLAPATAERLGVESGDVVALSRGGARVEIAALVEPGQAQGSVTVWAGYGRTGGLERARGVGVDIGPLRAGGAGWSARDVSVAKSGRRHELVTTQKWDQQYDREIARRFELAAWQSRPPEPPAPDPPSILPERLSGSPQWGMAVDLDKCTGCSACVIACQAENNIPVVGKAQVALGREMHWLRIDRYYGSAHGRLTVELQPMACQHCEKAPCEYVCPVNATVHSPDGLNEMVYNRCVGTRFCSNNCPYKVRRFNFYNYNQHPPELERMQKNPDVTVRGRGVMEKCSYCVQRIRRAQIDARLESHALERGAVQTACQQTCPTGAIVFGQVSDAGSAVSERQHSPRAYAVLGEIATYPRTRYLARLEDPNPELAE